MRVIPPERLCAELIALASGTTHAIVSFERSARTENGWYARVIREYPSIPGHFTWAAATTPERALAAALDEADDFLTPEPQESKDAT